MLSLERAVNTLAGSTGLLAGGQPPPPRPPHPPNQQVMLCTGGVVWALKPPSDTPLKSPMGSIILGPKGDTPFGSMPFHRAEKTLDFQCPTPSRLPS
jgi:hypothetical protein